MQARQFRYKELLINDSDWSDAMIAIAAVRSSCLLGIAQAFKVNLERTAFFQMWPAEIAFQSRRDTIFQCNATNFVSARWRTSIPEFLDQALTHELKHGMAVQIEHLEQQPKQVHDSLRRTLGIDYIEALLSMNEGMQITMDAIFASIVMSSWTAFECFVADAWVQAVNNGPAEIRIKVNASRHVKKKGEESDGLENKLKIDPVTDYGGSLIEAKRVSFQTLRNIKQFYGVILDKKETNRIFKDASEGYITALSEVRNVLTHKAGIVDSQFMQRVCAFPELNAFKEGESLLLNGELVKKLRAASAQTAASLISTVDDIISPPPAS